MGLERMESGEMEEMNMSERRYPNESKEYRDARASLLKDEQELVDKVKPWRKNAASFRPAVN